MDTQYVENTGGVIVIVVLLIFLALLAVVCAVFLIGKNAERDVPEKRNPEKSTDNKDICDFSNEKDRLYAIRKEEKFIAQKQYANAQITGREKYTSKLRRELDLEGILRWNETRGKNASAVAELTGVESNTEQLDITLAERSVNAISNCMVDYTDTAHKFAMLDISKIRHSVTKGGNIEVSCEVALTEIPLLCGKNAVLDGSLEVRVYNESGADIAVGYICATGFDETDLRKAGFVHCNDKEKSKGYSAICTTDKVITAKSAGKLKVTIEPYRLWTISI